MNDPHENATWVYSYDCGGNITSKAKYAYTTGTVGAAIETIPYVYSDGNWKDKLTSYDGQTITYDAIGNPTNDGTWSYTWEAGRQLKQMSTEGASVSFKYDHNGMRVQKVVEQSWYPETTNYIYHGKLLTHMTVDYTDFDEVAHQDKLHFFYDSANRPAKVEFNSTVYTYLHNLQGDIVGIVDNTGVLVVEYKYDAWGKPLSTAGTLADTLGKRNPFRYRGYVFDEETGLYYLRSRYYNPWRGQFINADSTILSGLLLCNSFTYCSNNPIKRIDSTGYAWYDGIANAWNKFTSFVQECFQAQAQADIISAQQSVYAVNKTVSGAEKIWNKAKSAINNWWENTAKPWLNQVKDSVKTFWNNAKQYAKEAFQAQQQADIISAQMTYNAACNIGNWISDNWQTAIDWVTAVAGVGGTAYGIIQSVFPVLPAIPVVGQVALLGAGIWGIARLAGWV